MITIHWRVKNETQEIPTNGAINATGKLILRYQRGARDMQGAVMRLLDPFRAIILEKTLPKQNSDEVFQLVYPLTHYLPYGSYRVLVEEDDETLFDHTVVINSRRKSNQVFLAQHKLVISNIRGRLKSFETRTIDMPSMFILQTTGPVLEGRGTIIRDDQIMIQDMDNQTQKTVSWSQVVQPTYLPLDVETLQHDPDEYYVLNGRHPYNDEPGLEISMVPDTFYNGTKEIFYPIKIIREVLNRVHRHMRYVRQSKERGVEYALKHGRGDCTEYAALVTTILRSVGIKARMFSGMGRSVHNNWISHAFIEVFIYGAWIPVDVVKPPKPTLQLGNRGDLIGISNKNWLDPQHQELQVKLQGYFQNGQPTISFERKITESAFSSLAKKNKHKPKKKLFQRRDSDFEINRSKNSLEVHQAPSDIKSLLLIDGTVDYGSIIAMSYYDGVGIRLPLHRGYHNDLLLAGIGGNGKLIGFHSITS